MLNNFEKFSFPSVEKNGQKTKRQTNKKKKDKLLLKLGFIFLMSNPSNNKRGTGKSSWGEIQFLIK